MTSPNPRISRSQLEALRTVFTELTPKPKTQFSNRDAVAELAKDIRHAQEKLGYSLADIAALLQQHGLNIRPNTLRGYLRDLVKTAEQAKKAKPATPSAREKRAASGVPAAPKPALSPCTIVFEDLPDEDVDERLRMTPVVHG